MAYDERVSTAEFEALKEAVAKDARALDTAWIVLCSESTGACILA
jgi:hypothetical protein